MVTILSYPRSGNHFVRYLIEFLTGRATIGASSLKVGAGQDTPICLRPGPQFLEHVSLDDPVADKVHFAGEALGSKGKLAFILRHPIKAIFPDRDKGRKLVFILRHPTEAILSHRYKFFDEINCKEPLSIEIKNKLMKDVAHFLGNIKFYNSFSGEKEVVLYEDLVGGRHEQAIESLGKLFDFDGKRRSDLLENFDMYQADSMKSPTRKPISAKKSGGEFYYSEMIKEDNPANLKEYLDIIDDLLRSEIIRKYYS